MTGFRCRFARAKLFGLLGPNGAGKSTSVSLAVGPAGARCRARVTIEGHGNPAEPAVRQTIGVAPQALALYDLLTGEENLRFFGEVYGLSGAQLDERVEWCLDFVGLTDRKGDRAGSYSGGMKRRLNLAAALMHDPELLLLDEPTVGVDPQSRNKIFESIEALHRDGRTIIYTTHYMEEAERLCDRIAIIDAGKLLALGTLDELLAAHGGPPTLIVKTNGAEQRLQTADPLAELNRIAAHDADRRVPDGAPDARAGVSAPDRPQPQGLTMIRQDHRARAQGPAPHAAQSRRHVLHVRVAGPRDGAVRHRVRRPGRRRAGQGPDCRRRRRQHRRLARVPQEARGVVRADADDAAGCGERRPPRPAHRFIVVKPGFGEASKRMFYGSPREIEVGVDPARQAEAGMIEGLLMKHAAADMQKMFTDPHASTAMVDKALGDMKQAPPDQVAPVQRFLGELKTFMGTPQSRGRRERRRVNGSR